MKISLFKKGLVVDIIVLFIVISIFSSNCTAINEIENDVKKMEFPKEFFNVEPSSDRMELLSVNSPIVEILYPEDGSIVYTSYTNFSVKFTDDTGLTDINVDYGGDSYTVGYGRSVYPPNKIFYLNRSMIRMRPGYVWIVAKAFDEDGNIGIDTAIFYYDDSNDTDLYPPEINLFTPYKGRIYIFGELLQRHFDIINCSIVIGKFEIIANIDDPERHLQKVEIYIDDEVVYEQEFFNSSWELIRWDCNKLLLGMHEIKIVAIDSYNNSAVEKLNCFIINFI